MGRAAQRLGVRAAFLNMRNGKRYDVTHRVNLRHLLRDIANGEIPSCMMSVPSTGWDVARDGDRPLRSGAQPWRIEKSTISLSLSDLACLDTGDRIMRTVIKLARQCQRFNVPWAIENPENSLCWMTITVARVVNDAQCVQNDVRFLCFWYQMGKTYNSSSQSHGLG